MIGHYINDVVVEELTISVCFKIDLNKISYAKNNVIMLSTTCPCLNDFALWDSLRTPCIGEKLIFPL